MKINSIPQRKSYLCLWVQIVKIRLSALSLHQTSGVSRSIKTKLNPDPDIRSGIAIHTRDCNPRRPKKNVNPLVSEHFFSNFGLKFGIQV